jgi:hypothetical protein
MGASSACCMLATAHDDFGWDLIWSRMTHELFWRKELAMIRSKRTLIATALVFVAAACSDQNELMFNDLPISAASVHLKGGVNAEPSYVDGGLTLHATGELTGLGKGGALITLNATADPSTICVEGGNENPEPISVSVSQAIPEDEITNGNTPFAVTTQTPDAEILAQDCGSTSETEEIEDLLWTSATITVEKPVGTVVLVISCEFAPPTSNGAVRREDVTCF